MILKFLIVLLAPIYLFADKCSVEQNIMKSILMNESHPKYDIGYEYFISFNSDVDAQVAKKFYKQFFIDSRTIDCVNKETCSKMLYIFVNAGIDNVDVGPYQLNYKYQRLDKMGDYFDFAKSYLHACNYVEKMVDKYGFGWWAIASYHSQTPKYNYRYQEKLIKNYYALVETKK